MRLRKNCVEQNLYLTVHPKYIRILLNLKGEKNQNIRQTVSTADDEVKIVSIQFKGVKIGRKQILGHCHF